MGTYQEIKLSKDVEEVVLSYSKDVTYIANGGEDQHLQMIYPSKTEQEKKYPVILYVLEGDQEAIYNKIPSLTKFAQRGYVIAMVVARKESDKEQENEYEAVLEFLQKNGEFYHLNMEQLFVLRDSMLIGESSKSLVIKKLEEKQLFKGIKAFISFGGSEEVKKLSNDVLNCPPILCVRGNGDLADQNRWWSEDNLDVLEDFMSNYIS